MSNPSRTCAALVAVLLLTASCGGGDDSPTGPSSSGPPFQRSGTGNDVVTKPSFVQRLHITAQYSGFSSNFIVWCDRDLIVNELLGTTWRVTSYSGTHATANCSQIEIRDSTGVSWQLAEVR
jgi:hypothetical protein